MFKTTYRDLAATVCGTLGLLTIAVSLILTPLPAWGDDGLPWSTAGCTGGGLCSTGCEDIMKCNLAQQDTVCTMAGSGGSCGCAATPPGGDCTGCECKPYRNRVTGVMSCRCVLSGILAAVGAR
jgi:hypothetical protein